MIFVYILILKKNIQKKRKYTCKFWLKDDKKNYKSKLKLYIKFLSNTINKLLLIPFY